MKRVGSGRRTEPVVVLGGTFDRLHVGHRAMFDAAFRQGGQVGVGITTDSYLRSHPKPLSRRIAPYSTRRRAVGAYLRARFPGRRFWISPLSDGFGRSLEPAVDILVVSAETMGGGNAVNFQRKKLGLPPLRIVRVPIETGEDGLPVTSRRVRHGDIDPSGRRVRPVRIGIMATGVSIPSAQLKAAVRAAFPGVPVRVHVGRSLPGPVDEARLAAASCRLLAPGREIAAVLSRLRGTSWRLTVADSLGVSLSTLRAPGTNGALPPRLPHLLRRPRRGTR